MGRIASDRCRSSGGSAEVFPAPGAVIFHRRRFECAGANYSEITVWMSLDNPD